MRARLQKGTKLRMKKKSEILKIEAARGLWNLQISSSASNQFLVAKIGSDTTVFPFFIVYRTCL